MVNDGNKLFYFGYGTNRDRDMMVAMVGRADLEGRSGQLFGHELLFQKLEHISDEVLPDAPFAESPRSIMRRSLGDDLGLYITRPNPNAVTFGTIWMLTPDEYEFVRDWELLDFGMQTDIKAMAKDADGNIVQVQTHGSLDPNAPMDHVVEGADYQDYIVEKDRILKMAVDARQEFLDRLKNDNQQ